MRSICKSVDELVGKTPLLELYRIEKAFKLKARVLAKLEFCNPAGSVKDRAAKAMIADAEMSGKLKPGATIIEPTSGNTGIALASVAAARGYKAVLVMPETMSLERRKLMQAFGAEIVLTPGDKGMAGAIEKARELCSETRGSFMPCQFENPANPKAHAETTGPEIFNDTEGAVDIFIAGVGSGGTISGAGGYLKARNPLVRVIAVEPASSPVLSGGKAGAHKIQGIGAGFVPDVLYENVYDEIIAVEDSSAFETARLIGKKEGFLAGISSGAAAWAAIEVAKRPKSEGKTIVVIFPDSGERYLSTGLFSD